MLLLESSWLATNLILKLNCYYKNSVCLWCPWLESLGMCWHATEKKFISPWERQEWQTDGGRSIQFSSVTQSCPVLCKPMHCSTPGFPVQHQLPELAQTHFHRVSDDIQPSHSLSSPSPAFSLSQHQGLFQWVSTSNQVARVLELHLQHHSFQLIFRGVDCL